MRLRGSALLALLVALVVAVSGCDTAGQTVSSPGRVGRDFFGLQQTVTGAGEQGAQLAGMAAAHVGVVRHVVPWADMEPSPGVYDFASFDAFVADASRHGLRVLPFILGAPTWSLPHPRGRSAAVPPRDPGMLAVFATRLVERYGPRGSFWRAHPGLHRYPIRAWQIWNEPNLPTYWGGHPRARDYVALLRAAYRAIHRADRGATVVSAGIPNSHRGIPFVVWVTRFFRAGGRGTFDAFGLHAYAHSVTGVLAAVAQARGLLRNGGAPRVPIWITEFGWANDGNDSPFTVSSRTQAYNVEAALNALAARRTLLGVRGAVYFEWRDTAPPGAAEQWGSFTGLVRLDGRRKPAFRAFARAAQALRRP